MKGILRTRSVVALIGAVAAIVALGGGTATGSSFSPVTRTFSFIGRNSKTATTIVNIDSLTINARCVSGSPVIFAFTSAARADLFGRIFDGLGRLHIVKNSNFNNKGKGVSLSTSSGDFDSTGTVLFETPNGTVVTVNYAFDNATTLGGQNLCTVYGSMVAT